MNDLLEEITAHLEAGSSAFAERFPHMFLLRQPRGRRPSDAAPSMETPTFEYRTATVTADTDGFLPWQWWVEAVVKKPGSRFPDSLSIGRAQTCDIEISQKFISKLHARIHLQGGWPTQLEDCKSSNGTFINGRRLTPGTPIELRSGDRIGFGSLEVVLLDPESCFIAFRTRRHTLPTGPRRSGKPPAP